MYNLYNLAVNGDCRVKRGPPPAFCWVGPLQRAKQDRSLLQRPAMKTEDEMKVPLKHRTLSAAIVDQLRQSILDGTYPAGSQLRQDALGEAYGVSRIPVREALFQLEAEGLVRIVPQKGAIVSELSFDEINDVFDLRLILEPRLLAQSAPGFTTMDLEGL